MCYSAQIIGQYRQYLRLFGARMSLREFVRTFWERRETEGRLKLPKALEEAFLADTGPDAELATIREHILAYRKEQAGRWEAELFKQVKRKADAERTLATKTTKKAEDDLRISSAKVEQLKGWLADLQRAEPQSRDSRIFPGWYAPVMVWGEDGPVVLPMRYQCRPAGKPAFYDSKYPGTYNARRDNLEGFWKGLFGRHHGVMLIDAFYENVDRDGAKAVLKFEPRPRQAMLVACLWSRWSAPGEPDLLSFAAITDEPPEEVAAAGHDRCIIPIKAENVEAWLRPDPKDLQAQYAILDDRERPYYEHRLAA
jgi:putative SOS response-associated peptidase YedK